MHVPPKLTLDDLARNQVKDIIDITDATEKQNIHEVYIPPLNSLKTKWQPNMNFLGHHIFSKFIWGMKKVTVQHIAFFSDTVWKMVLSRV